MDVLRVALLSVCGLVLPGILRADGVISGQVTAADAGAALSGATVTAHHVASGRTTRTVVGNDGRYELAGLAAGPYRLTAVAPSFTEASRGVRLADGARLNESFALRLGVLEEEITVTAARGERALVEIPQAVTVLSASELEDRRPRSVQEALDRVPNMFLFENNPARSRPSYRGYRSSRLLLLLDGERMNNPAIDANFGGLSPSILDVTQLSSVEVVGGAGSSLYGSDAHGGTIQLVTREPTALPGGRRAGVVLEGVYAENGDFDREYAEAEHAGLRWGLRASISRFDQKSYDMADEAIPLSEVLALGELSNQLAGNANTYTVWELPAGSEVANSQGRGTNGRFDLWFHPSDTQTVRATYLDSSHEDLGVAFVEPPQNNTRRWAERRDFEKLSLRYEAVDLSRQLSRVAARFHRQSYSEPLVDQTFTLDEGSSYVFGPSGPELTGNPSTFTSGGTLSVAGGETTTTGGEVQLNLVPFSGAILTAGVQLSRDEVKSDDSFTRSVFDGSGTTLSTIVGATLPNATYENLGAFAQLEWRPAGWLRVTGGVRYDDWRSEAMPTEGYPLPGGSELGFLGVALDQLGGPLADFGITLDGVAGYVAAVAAGEPFSTKTDVRTGNLGLTFLLPGGFHPYVRWGDSYREPEVTTRYPLRNFGSAFFGAQSIPNPFLAPEEGESLEAGLKLDRGHYRASLAWFESKIDNYVDTVVTPLLFFEPDPARGVLTTVGLFFQGINRSKVELEGWEAYFEGSFRWGGKGTWTPYVSLGWLEGRNLSPTPAELRLIEEVYNRDDTPLRLEGSAKNVPFGDVVPFQGSVALRYTGASGRWFGEYEYRFVDEITRVRPEAVATGNVTTFGILKSFEGFEKHTLRSGYELANVALKLTFAVENLTDELYFVPYEPAPAPGRSYVFGVSYRFRRNY